jgi:tetratricopeptide (TPR) repeat protein
MPSQKHYYQMLRKLFFFFGILFLMPINCQSESSLLEEAMQAENAGNYTKAMFSYDLALKSNFKNRTAHKRKGLLLIRNPESWGVGIWHLEKALELDSLDQELRKELFYLYLATENFDSAENFLFYWKTTNQDDIYKDMEALLLCETKSNRLKTAHKTVDESPIIPEFWKKRCESR